MTYNEILYLLSVVYVIIKHIITIYYHTPKNWDLGFYKVSSVTDVSLKLLYNLLNKVKTKIRCTHYLVVESCTPDFQGPSRFWESPPGVVV